MYLFVIGQEEPRMEVASSPNLNKPSITTYFEVITFVPFHDKNFQ